MVDMNNSMNNKLNGKGWRGESMRHSLAARGVKTGSRVSTPDGVGKVTGFDGDMIKVAVEDTGEHSFDSQDVKEQREPGLFSEHGWDAMEEHGRGLSEPGRAIAEAGKGVAEAGEGVADTAEYKYGAVGSETEALEAEIDNEKLDDKHGPGRPSKTETGVSWYDD